MDYKKQYSHPKWQKKRLEILERDNWECQEPDCDNKGNDTTLHVHHKMYIPNTKVWDYHNDLLITYCESCHNSIHGAYKLDNTAVLSQLYQCGFSIYNMVDLAEAFYYLGKVKKPNKFIHILRRFFIRIKEQDI